jgi:TP901 family phage tail tape measure protein
MAAPNNSNLVLQLLITAKDEASAAFGKVFKYLDDNTKVVAGKIREAFTGIFGGGLDSAIDFEAQLDRVAAKGGYTASEIEALQQAAQQLGAQFGISGTEAAQGMESLAAAGLSAKEAIATLPQVLALASSEQISADAAATKLIDSLSIMGLGFEEAGRMADVLSKGADITTSSASQLAEALSMAGGTARAAGMDLEYTVAALDLLHKNGIKGSEAGTALRAILTALLDPASKASQELDALGITSRDLGTVMAALQARGAAASGAILAFGQEAGPGLRALISEGQGGLTEYITQLKNAEGAALATAEQTGGNLKSALDTLSSAWESLKSALLDPLLEPITKQVRELAGAFQEGLSSDKFKAVQDTIKEFGESAAKAIGDFIRSFDFQGTLNAVASFAAQAKAHFGGLSDAGSKAASVVIIGWNAVSAGFKTVGAAMVEIVASIIATLANIEEAASKIGLGSVERANELRQKALDMQATASELMNSVATDAAEMSAAFDQLTTKAETAKTAVDSLKAAAEVPPNAATLEPLVRTLDDYKAALDRAKISQEQAAQAASDAEADYLLAGQAMDNGAGSAYRYEEATRAHQAAQAALKAETEGLTQASSDYTLAMQRAIREVDTESAAVTAGIKTKQQQIEELKKAAEESGRYATAVEKLADAQTAGIRAEIELAKAKGDTVEVQRLTRELAIQEAEGAAQVAQAKWAEQQAEAALAIAKLEQLNAIQEKNAETEKQIQLALLAAKTQLAEAEAAGKSAEALQLLADKVRLLNGAKQDEAGSAEEAAEAQRQAAKATKDAGDAAEKTTEQVKNMNVAWAKFGELQATAFGTGNISRFNDLIDDIQRAIDQANTTAQRLADEGLGSIAGGAVQAAIQVEGMARVLDESESYLNDAARAASENLRGALQQAREEAEGLAESMAGMAEDFRREILQIQGDQRTLLELDYQDSLAKLDELHERAGTFADEEYEAARAQAEALHRLKLQQLADEEKADQTAEATAKVRQLADEAERAGRALSAVSAVNLAPLSSQANQLNQAFNNLNGVL